jgi:exonuclease VII large subunit
LYNEKDDKKIRIQALKEQYHVKDTRERAMSSRRSSNNTSRKPSPRNQDHFYEKQMHLKQEADKRLMLKMQEKNMKTENKRYQRSCSKKKLKLNKKSIENVHERLFNDVKERSRKRMEFELDSSKKHYESQANLSISSLGKCDSKHQRSRFKKDNSNHSLYIPKINK